MVILETDATKGSVETFKLLETMPTERLIRFNKLSSLQLTDMDISQWLPDSGASSHMTGNASNFTTLNSYDGLDHVIWEMIKLYQLNIVVLLQFKQLCVL